MPTIGWTTPGRARTFRTSSPATLTTAYLSELSPGNDRVSVATAVGVAVGVAVGGAAAVGTLVGVDVAVGVAIGKVAVGVAPGALCAVEAGAVAASVEAGPVAEQAERRITDTKTPQSSRMICLTVLSFQRKFRGP